MNIVVCVEGELGSKKIYEEWIPLVNPKLSKVGSIYELLNNNFVVLASFGYPGYFDRINEIIHDVSELDDISRLVIAVDAEELTYKEKLEEMNDFIVDKTCSIDIRIVIQYYCFETWALGNRRLSLKNCKTKELRSFKKHYNVNSLDPELMPSHQEFNLNRAQFSSKYLRYLLNNKYRNLTYQKNNPIPMLHPKYFENLRKRLIDMNHIQSFAGFCRAFA